MAGSAGSALERLAALRTQYGEEAARERRDLLARLERGSLRTAEEVLGLHDLLCFLRAFPDDAEVLARVTRMLASFETRRDLRRHRPALADSGIVGTTTTFRFFAPTARWLARRWGASLTIDWADAERPERLEPYLPVLATWTESPALDEQAEDVPTWIDRMKGSWETDAEFLLRRLDQIRIDPVLLDELLDGLDLPLVLAPGEDTPSRTREHVPARRVHFQTQPLARGARMWTA